MSALVQREALLLQVRSDADQAFELLQRSLRMLEDARLEFLSDRACEAANQVVDLLDVVGQEMRAQSCSPYPLHGRRLSGGGGVPDPWAV